MAGAGRLAELSGSVRRRFEAACPPGPVLVALSGGADSAVCAWAATQTGRPVRAAFVDHGFAESPRLQDAAREVAAALRCDLTTLAVTVGAGPSPEVQARQARLDALETAVAPGEHLLTGHTMDDQAETVLGNLLRGAGATGLAGIPARRGVWARPLLAVTRAETRELAGLLRLPFADDPTNLAAEPRRNVLRREVLPELEARFNPALRRSLARTARLLASDDAHLDGAAAAVPVRMVGGRARLPAPLLATLPVPVAARAVRGALRRVHPPYPGSEADVGAVLAVAAGTRPRDELSGGHVADREGPWVLVGPRRVVAAWPATPWSVPGATAVPGFRLDAWIEERPPALWPLGAATTVLDADAVGAEVTLRPVAAGDRIDMSGGSKPVGAALAEAGVAAARRQHWPVLAVGGRLVWLVGVRAARSARPGPGSKRFLWVAAAMEDR